MVRTIYFLISSIIIMGDATVITSSQSVMVNAVVLNMRCKNGTYTTAICSKNTKLVASTSQWLLKMPIEKSDFVFDLQFHALNH